jgi:Rrf2 family protein
VAANCQFAFAVHTLAVLAHRGAAAVNSGALARSVNTNAVVIRRLLSDLRAAGLIVTQRGAAGGARLSRPLGEISLDQIYQAVGDGRGFAHHPHPPNPRCPVGCRIETVLGEVFSSAQAALERALAERTLADVLDTMNEAAPVAKKSPRVRRNPPARIGRRPDSLSKPAR